MNAPKLLLSLIRGEPDYQAVLSAGIQPGDFGPAAPVLGFIGEYRQRFGKFPDRSLLQEKYPDLIVEVEADLDFAIGEMRSWVQQHRVDDALVRYRNGDLNLSGLSAELEEAKRFGQVEQARYSDQSIVERRADWDVTRNNPRNSLALRGFRTGIGSLDRTKFGWQRGDLVTIFGRPEAGKSFLLLWHAVTAWKSGHRILFISPELTTAEVEGRFDALVAGQNNIAISARGIRNGNGITEKDFDRLQTVMATRADWRTVSGSFTSGEIRDLVLDEKPRIVCVDGLYLLTDKADSAWMQVKQISGNLKRMAVDLGVVVLAVNQAVRDKKLMTQAPEPTDMAFGDALVRDSDKLLAIYNPDQVPDARYLAIQKDRSGGWAEVRGQPIVLDWRVDAGVIKEKS